MVEVTSPFQVFGSDLAGDPYRASGSLVFERNLLAGVEAPIASLLSLPFLQEIAWYKFPLPFFK